MVDLYNELEKGYSGNVYNARNYMELVSIIYIRDCGPHLEIEMYGFENLNPDVGDSIVVQYKDGGGYVRLRVQLLEYTQQEVFNGYKIVGKYKKLNNYKMESGMCFEAIYNENICFKKY